ncbi:MAG: peptidyl-prolyl cis-trans isomerase Mip [Lysobacteraceae bacterium]|nr:MAG: peptidyl-prolyl cis-trans isomerase Mip [Xanthomonadaceae bacterium]
MPAAAQEQVPIDKEKLSYAIGYQIGADFSARELDIEIETVIRALRDALTERDPAYPVEEMAAQLDVMQQQFLEENLKKLKELAAENQERSDKFLADNRANPDVVVLPSGVQYRVMSEGSGQRPNLEDEVMVHYRGQRMDGFEFDSSFARGVPAAFKVNGVLRGWQEILPLMKVGAEWRVWIPPELAYGERGQRPIGPNEALQFDIKLLEIKS